MIFLKKYGRRKASIQQAGPGPLDLRLQRVLPEQCARGGWGLLRRRKRAWGRIDNGLVHVGIEAFLVAKRNVTVRIGAQPK